jgi:hypothetical protein
VVVQADVVSISCGSSSSRGRRRCAILALPAGCGSEEESEVGVVCERCVEARRCCVVACCCYGWSWFLAWWWWPSLSRSASLVEGRSCRGGSLLRVWFEKGASLRRLAAACSVTPSGPQGCRATTPNASIKPSWLLSRCERPKWLVPRRWCSGQSSVAASEAWR